MTVNEVLWFVRDIIWGILIQTFSIMLWMSLRSADIKGQIFPSGGAAGFLSLLFSRAPAGILLQAEGSACPTIQQLLKECLHLHSFALTLRVHQHRNRVAYRCLQVKGFKFEVFKHFGVTVCIAIIEIARIYVIDGDLNTIS